MTMPWDRFPATGTPEPSPAPQPVPEPVPQPPQPVLVPAPLPDVGAALSNALEDVWPVLKQQAMDYARKTVQGIVAGEAVDPLHPTITGTDSTGRELVKADAKSRSKRTFVQGLIFDLFAGLIAVVATLSGADPFVAETWIAFGVLLLKTCVSAVISYFMRLKITPTIRERGEKMALMPVPRPMIDEERKPA
jgi:hypothetical protein